MGCGTGARPDHEIGVRDEIEASWRRSAGFGLDPDHFAVPHDPDIDIDSRLARAAGPVVSEVAEDVGSAHMAVVVSDAAGQVLDLRVAERSLRAGLDRISLVPGFIYAEQQVGTNAIGTALVEGRPSTVTGGEHFADALTAMACAAVPVCDPSQGRVLGVIDLTCRAEEAQPLMLPLARQAAREVERRLVDDRATGERALLSRFLAERRRAKGPLVAVGARTFLTNAAADRLVLPEDEAALRECASSLLEAGTETAELLLAGGEQFGVRSQAVSDGGDPIGTVLWLSPSRAARPDRPRRPYGWPSLTDAERRVAMLAAEGLTNRQIADLVVVSPYTVDTHLRSIFRKLDVSSRVELTRVALEESPPGAV